MTVGYTKINGKSIGGGSSGTVSTITGTEELTQQYNYGGGGANNVWRNMGGIGS